MTTTDICFDDLCDRPTVRVSLFERVLRAMDRLSEWHKRAVERRELLEMPEHLLKGAAFRGECQFAGPAVEQGEPEVFLELLDLLADRALGLVQFLGGPREAQVAGGGLEGPKGSERGQFHRWSR